MSLGADVASNFYMNGAARKPTSQLFSQGRGPPASPSTASRKSIDCVLYKSLMLIFKVRICSRYTCVDGFEAQSVHNSPMRIGCGESNICFFLANTNVFLLFTEVWSGRGVHGKAGAY